MAWHYKQYQLEQPTQERLLYTQEEKTAKRVGQGYGKMRGRYPPRELRRPKREEKAQ